MSRPVPGKIKILVLAISGVTPHATHEKKIKKISGEASVGIAVRNE